MKRQKLNLPASVAARLLNRARQTGDNYQTLFTSFYFERFLYRIEVSSARARFVLKGAMLLRLWSDQPYRATVDLDLLRKGDGSFAAIRTDIETICSTQVEPDAVVFDPTTLRIEAIRPEDEYAGTRVNLPAAAAPPVSRCRSTWASATRSGRHRSPAHTPHCWSFHRPRSSRTRRRL